MKILMIANFVSLPWEKGNSRFIYLLNNIDCKKNEVELITSDFYHNTKEKRKIEYNLPFKLTLIEEKGYKKNVCLKRFISHYKWGKKVKKYLDNIDKPDVIYCAVPSLTGASKVASYCKKNKIRFIIDVQDLWPEAFKMIFNIPIISNIIFYPLQKMANKIYKNADEICGVSKTYCKRAISVNKKCKKYHSVFLGTDLEMFDNNAKKEYVTDELNDDCIEFNSNTTIIEQDDFKLFKPKNEIWIAYCGTLGSSYDLNNAITAISNIKNDNIRFIVMGNGPLFSKFTEKAISENINAVFTGRISYDKMCSILCKCDIAINPIRHGAAQSIINKHADYVASGLPIISTQESSEFCELVEKYNMGFNCKNDDINDIVTSISKLINNAGLRKKMGANARECAIEKFNRKNTYKELINLILEN